MDSETYELYVKTDCWELRKQAYKKRHAWCEVCGISAVSDEIHEEVILDVHHLTYDRLGHEADSDLAAVCRMCHGMFHGFALRQYAQVALASLQAQQELLKLPKRALMIERIEELLRGLVAA